MARCYNEVDAGGKWDHREGSICLLKNVTRQEAVDLTIEGFERELRMLQDTLELTEEQIQKAMEMHRRYKHGDIKIPEWVKDET